MKRRVSAEEMCRLLDSALVTIRKLTGILRALVVHESPSFPTPIVCIPASETGPVRPPMRALIPLSALQDAQRISQKPGRRRQKQRGRRKSVEVVYATLRRPLMTG